MSFTAKELTDYLKELKKAQGSLDQLLDFTDLAIKDNEKFSDDLTTPAEKIRCCSDTISSSIKEFNNIFNAELNKIPLDADEIKQAAERLMLYHGDKMQVIIWAEQQRVNFEENSYWWKYWTGVLDYVHKKSDKN